MIDFKEGAVCYFDGAFHYAEITGFVQDEDGYTTSFYNAMNYDDFQLNEPREGWYIPKSELDTEEKYNKAVEAFGLFGFTPFKDESFKNFNAPWDNISVSNGRIAQSGLGIKNPTKCTFAQLMAIGELKRKMLEREKSAPEIAPDLTPDNKRRNKSKQAYDILKGLDYEYDEVKQKWYKKEWV